MSDEALKIAVLVKASVDPNMIQVDSSGNIDIDAMPLAISEYDKNAIEEAVRIKEKMKAKITVLSALTWGPMDKRSKEAENVLREALAMGAEEAHLVLDEALIPGDPLITSAALAKLAEKLGGFNLYLTGEASMDMLSSQLPPRLAELLGMPILSFVKSLELSDGKIKAVRSLENVVQTVETSLPAVVSVTGEINQPRYATMLQIRMAFRKPINRHTFEDLGLSPPERKLERKAITLLAVERKRKRIEGENIDEIAAKLVESLAAEGVIKG